MRFCTPLTLVALLFGCAGPSSPATHPHLDDTLTSSAPRQERRAARAPAAAKDLLAAHNAARAAVHNPKPAKALAPFTWSAEAARVAQAWASRCQYGHNGGRGERGENIAAYTGNSSPLQAVALWIDEAKDYDYGSNGCAAGKACGHYTQVVWANTTRVGCGVATCDFLGQGTTYVVCDYEPPGNYVGQRPY